MFNFLFFCFNSYKLTDGAGREEGKDRGGAGQEPQSQHETQPEKQGFWSGSGEGEQGRETARLS